MFYDIAITAAQAAALGEWTCVIPDDDFHHPAAAVELVVAEDYLVARQGDDYCAWSAAGAAVEQGDGLDQLLDLGRRPRPITTRADVETVERMRREAGE